MKKAFKLFFSFLIMTVMFFGIKSNVNAVEIPKNVTVTGFNWLGSLNTGRYGIFAVEPSGGTHAYCLDVNMQAPENGTLVWFDMNQKFSYAQINRMIAVLRTAGDPNFTFGLSETDSFYVTQAALWYAEYGRTGSDLKPLTTEFHNFLLNSSVYGNAYNKLLSAIDEADAGRDFTKESNSISVGSVNSELGQSMHEVVIDGKTYLISDTEFKINVEGNYTITVEGGYLADAAGNNTGLNTATYSENDSFRIIIPVDNQDSVSATFTATTDEYVSEYQLHGYQSLTVSGLQRLALLFKNTAKLSTSYTVNGTYNNEIKTDIKIAKVNSKGELIPGAKLGIYKNEYVYGPNCTGEDCIMYAGPVYLDDSLVGSYDSIEDYITVSLKPGKYALKEISAPKGYILSDEVINFEIDENGNVKDSNGNVVTNKTFTVVNELPTIKIRKVNEKGIDIKNVKIQICSYDMNTKQESDCNFEYITDGSIKELTVGVDFGKISDGSYIIKELEAPHGFEISNPKYITIKDGKIFGDLQQDVVTIVDESYLEVSKTDATGQKELAGAKMTLYDKKGNLIENWTSEEGKTHKITGLVIGDVYEIVEDAAPTGYVKLSTSIKFRLNNEGKVETLNCNEDSSECSVMSTEEILEIKNDVTKVKISKIDVTNQKEQPGATLRILDENDKPVYQDNKILEWVSSDEAHYIEMLPVGKYKLVETIVPDGYAAVTSEVLFEVKENTGIQTVVFENDVTKLYISKRDFTTGEEVAGAHLQILDVDRNVIVEWDSTNEPKYIEKLPIGEYILVETIPANGYKNGMIIDGMLTSEYKFEIKDSSVVKIDVYNQVLEVPNTGINETGTYVIGSMVMLAGVGTITVSRKKREI